jgi:glycosyltransferase involved in cell wall biosynthesis
VPDDLRVLLVLARSTGGIGRHVRTLAEGLPLRGVRPTVCAPASTLHTLALGGSEAAIVEAPIDRGSPPAVRASRKVLRGLAADADIVHAHGLRAGAECVAYAGGTPLVVTWHNAPLGGPAWRTAHRALRRYVARSTDLTLAASADLADEARRCGAHLVRTVFVTAPALPAPHRPAAELRAELGVGDRPVVLAIGRLQRQKRLDVLVDAAAGWANDSGAPVVVLAGDGPARDDLRVQAAAIGAAVVMLGSRDDVAELLAVADVVALPSEWEARALVAQEALRCGVPLITTDVGGMRDLVGEAAVFVPVGDPPALRAAIEALLGEPARRERLAALGRARASSWPDEARTIDDLIKAYRDLIRRAEGR